MSIKFPYKQVHDKKIHATKGAARPLVSSPMLASAHSGFQVSLPSASPYPVLRWSVGTITSSTTCCPRTTAPLCRPGAIQCRCCSIVCHTNKIDATKMCGASPSDLPHQRSSIMMHSSGDLAARRHRRSHAAIPSRHPRSLCTSTWPLSHACYVRACWVVSLCVMRDENIS